MDRVRCFEWIAQDRTREPMGALDVGLVDTLGHIRAVWRSLTTVHHDRQHRRRVVLD